MAHRQGNDALHRQCTAAYGPALFDIDARFADAMPVVGVRAQLPDIMAAGGQVTR